ncbi:MAG: XRE family transcriptional regulator [Saccharofermentans sp.]|nr:XRE family transcriptional regulator [Saccharofermentans sp.]
MKEKQTKELLNILKDTSNKSELRNVLESESFDLSGKTFAQYFMELTIDNNETRALLVKESQIERTYCYQILNGTKQPGRDKVIALCLAAKVGEKETQHCLFLSSNAQLHPRNRRDAIIIYAINNNLGVRETNNILSDLEEGILE